MSEVKRYGPTCDCMAEMSWGDYVLASDFDKQAQEIERLNECHQEAMQKWGEAMRETGRVKRELSQLKSRQSGVVLPERSDPEGYSPGSPEWHAAHARNACLDEVARLNPAEQMNKAQGDHNEHDLGMVKAEAVKVVAYRYTNSARIGGKWYYQESFPKWDDRKVRELGKMDELMTVAQHERIVAAVTRPADPDMVHVPRELMRECVGAADELLSRVNSLLQYSGSTGDDMHHDCCIEQLRAILSSKGGDV